MKKNSILEERRKRIPNEIRKSVSYSFAIVDKIHEILEQQGKTQKDLARLMGKSQAEISKWMRGTHNFTIETLCRISEVLGENVIEIPRAKKQTEVTTMIYEKKISQITYCETISDKRITDTSVYTQLMR